MSKKIFTSSVIIFFVYLSTKSLAQVPNDYYTSTYGLSGDQLKEELNNIIKNHIEYAYSGADTNVWDILKAADYSDNDPSKVVLIYTGWEVNGAQEYNNGAGWTREHIWAKIHGDFGVSKGAGTDCHNLRPADVSVNSKKNTRWFDYSNIDYIDQSGYKEGSGFTGCKFDNENWTWEPRDEVKGDVARSLFYMATRYEGDDDEVDLELVDYFPADNNSTDPVHAKLSTLLEWHIQDPPDAYEKRRHEIIYQYQNNRNPFIDHPEFACSIWGGSCVGSVLISEYIEGSSFNKAIEIYNGSSTSIDLSSYELRIQVNGSGSWSSGISLFDSLPSGKTFTICNSKADSFLLSKSNLITNSSVVNFNGNDPLGLFKDDKLIDIVGEENAGGEDFGKDVTIVRKKEVITSNDLFDPSEWIAFSSNTFDFYGSHSTNSSSVLASNLFISEYIEGSSNSKALELFNGTGEMKNLGLYSIRIQSNGTGEWSSGLELTGDLDHGNTYSICRSNADSALIQNADLLTTNVALNFNGNDPIGLFYGDSLIDLIGVKDSVGYFATDVTLTRKMNILAPNDTFNLSEWNVYSQNHFIDFGRHTFISNGRTLSDLSELSGTGQFNDMSTLTAYPNPFDKNIFIKDAGKLYGSSKTLLITNALGEIVFYEDGLTNKEDQVETMIETSELNPGLYILTVSGLNSTKSIKLIKH